LYNFSAVINQTEFLVLKAGHGDSIIIKTFDASNNPYNIVIDGGIAKTFDEVLKKELSGICNINLLVLTHIDSDHIAGLIKYIKNPFFKPEKIECYWFNAGNIRFIGSGEKISFNQAKTFEELLILKGEITEKWSSEITRGSIEHLAAGISTEILSPTIEVLENLFEKWPALSQEYQNKLKDVAIAGIAPSQVSRGTLEELALKSDSPEKSIMSDLFNSSSIAFVLYTPDLSILLLGDAHPELIIASLVLKGYTRDQKLKVDYVKVSHHGSKNNTMNDLLDLIDCEHFIISTNGGNSDHRHPDRETIARIVHHPERIKYKYKSKRTIYFNYPLSHIERKSGKLFNDTDFLTGNWDKVDDKTLFRHEQ
jgi:beta-lactamase superfamily II metal-dependent hydrolase